MYSTFFKRIFDVIFSLLAIIVLSPLFIIISIVIPLDSKGTVFFKQERIGLNKKIFKIIKFRTMIMNAYAIGGIASSENDPRITKVGSLLRKTSLDELPQLFNIFIGQMSFIGPRPILKEEFAPFVNNPEYIDRHSIRPGLFCSVDVQYRASADRVLQMNMDIDYVYNVSFLFDCLIFLKTLYTVLKRKNVYKES